LYLWVYYLKTGIGEGIGWAVAPDIVDKGKVYKRVMLVMLGGVV